MGRSAEQSAGCPIRAAAAGGSLVGQAVGVPAISAFGGDAGFSLNAPPSQDHSASFHQN